MKALCYHGVRDIRYESYPDPKLQDDRDVNGKWGMANGVGPR